MNASDKLVIIGGSAGSLEVILKVLPGLKADLAFPLIIVLHRKTDHDSTLADLLASRTSLKVKEAEEKEMLRPGVIYIAPVDYHLLIEKDGTLSLDYSEKINYSRPSIDPTFESAAEVYRRALLCILLSGANADGVDGLEAVKAQEGIVAVQDPATAEVPFMPQQAIRRMSVDYVVKAQEIITLINGFGDQV